MRALIGMQSGEKETIILGGMIENCKKLGNPSKNKAIKIIINKKSPETSYQREIVNTINKISMISADI